MIKEDEVIADEARFVDMPIVTADAEQVIEKARRLFSEPRYADGETSLTVRWIPSEEFRAWAAVSGTSRQRHEIALSYGAAREIYRDAFVLPQFCEKHFARDQYASVYDPMPYGGGHARVLPAGLTINDAKVRIMNSTLAWLYLHEQSHLFQNHGEIGAALGADWAMGDNRIDEMRDRAGPPPTGKSAALSHVLELAADHEAMNNVVGLILKANGDTLPQSSLWSLIVGLICMFQRFYGQDDRTMTNSATGSHPDPAYRMRILLRSMHLLLMHPGVKAKLPWLIEGPEFGHLADHAVITATMYCHIRYLGTDRHTSAFLPGVQGYAEVPDGYRQQLFETWQEVRPLILDRYRGWGHECVLDIPTPAHLG